MLPPVSRTIVAADPDLTQGDRDVDQVIAFSEREYGSMSAGPTEPTSRADFIWRRDHNPAGQATIPMIRNANGDVVGLIWLVPLRIRLRNQNYLAATGTNLLIHPDSRQGFGYVKLMRRFNQALEDNRLPLHFSFISNEKHYLRLRSENPEKAFSVPLLVKPLDFAGVTDSYFKTGWQRSIGRKVGWLASLAFSKAPFIGRNKDIRVETVEQFDERFDEFWRRIEDKRPAMVIRDRAFLAWRFAKVSGRQYHILVASLKGEMLGYAVTRCAKVRGIDTGLVLDLLLLDNALGLEGGSCLAVEAEALFRAKGMSLMASLATPRTPEFRTLRQGGCRNLGLFAPRTFHFAFFVHDSNQKALESLNVRDWFLTFGDFVGFGTGN
jgi:hypothetical protein